MVLGAHRKVVCSAWSDSVVSLQMRTSQACLSVILAVVAGGDLTLGTLSATLLVAHVRLYAD
jgi:hypothetical protein